MSTFELEKEIWTEQDFNIMGWHDATIWSMTANSSKFEYLLDLDYIFQWVSPQENETYFKFWVSPVTMVFENAFDINLDIESQQGLIEVADLHMENPELTPNGKFISHTYRFECQEGELSLKSTGFKMYVRQHPKLLQVQSFELDERGGVNFARELKTL
ncbi:hypothetical protein [Vibrio navarrensis]|uniref:hypothetical protein n=1 Tax=Vibrio navarrensis TaxID=29495 RepID=UPI001867D0AA|nr:hypothetical protein [Vibrio navarrensis]MBE3654943.1 hypothetical protein [Vibrio navarrensis]